MHIRFHKVLYINLQNQSRYFLWKYNYTWFTIIFYFFFNIPSFLLYTRGDEARYLTSREPSRGNKLTLYSLVWRSGTDSVTDSLIEARFLSLADAPSRFSTSITIFVRGRQSWCWNEAIARDCLLILINLRRDPTGNVKTKLKDFSHWNYSIFFTISAFSLLNRF